YIACASVILMVAQWFQGANPKKTPNHDQATPYPQSEYPAVPVTKSSAVVKLPAAANAEVDLQTKFYEDAANEEEQEKAL
ncbi:M23 family peptidase, partial [Bacillus cereus]|nr:M23 family peptidase [Bacillus cereus]